MKNFNLFLLLVLMGSCTTHQRESDLEASSLLGPVAKLKETTYSAVKVNGKHEIIKIQTVDDYAYSSEGFVEYSMYAVPAYYYSEIYTYDEEGRPKNFVEVRGKDSTYAQCKLVLDDRGQILEEQWVDPDGQASAKYVNVYDKNMLVETKKLSSAGALISILRYHYNDNGMQDSVLSYKPNNELKQFTHKEFEGKWVVKASTYVIRYGKQTLVMEKMFEYNDLDKEGNWTSANITQVDVSKQDTMYNVIERQLRYYED